MSKLTEYLNTHFTDKKYCYETIKKHFYSKFGVCVKEEDCFLLFRYGQYTAKWNQDVTHECRGAILHHDGKRWYHKCRPADKFFNQHEPQCVINQTPEQFEHLADELTLVEKADGTCINLWFDFINESWRVSTLGRITTTQIYGGGETFESMFLRILFGKCITMHAAQETLNQIFDKYHTYKFEACGKENPIVTQYATERIFLIGARHNKSGQHLCDSQLERLNQTAQSKNLWLRLPYKKSLTSLGLKSLADVQAYMEEQYQNTEKFGVYAEGFIIYWKNKPVSKLKNPGYIARHKNFGKSLTKTGILKCFFENTIDDVFDQLSCAQQELVSKVRSRTAELVACVLNDAEKLNLHDFKTRKDYASHVREIVKIEALTHFFYSHYDSVVSDTKNLEEHFETWIKKTYKRFEWPS